MFLLISFRLIIGWLQPFNAKNTMLRIECTYSLYNKANLLQGFFKEIDVGKLHGSHIYPSINEDLAELDQ